MTKAANRPAEPGKEIFVEHRGHGYLLGAAYQMNGFPLGVERLRALADPLIPGNVVLELEGTVRGEMRSVGHLSIAVEDLERLAALVVTVEDLQSRPSKGNHSS